MDLAFLLNPAEEELADGRCYVEVVVAGDGQANCKEGKRMLRGTMYFASDGGPLVL